MYFRNYGLRKMWLDIYIKSPVSEDPLRGNIVNGPRYCWNPKSSTVTIFIAHYEGNLVGKSLFL